MTYYTNSEFLQRIGLWKDYCINNNIKPIRKKTKADCAQACVFFGNEQVCESSSMGRTRPSRTLPSKTHNNTDLDNTSINFSSFPRCSAPNPWAGVIGSDDIIGLFSCTLDCDCLQKHPGIPVLLSVASFPYVHISIVRFLPRWYLITNGTRQTGLAFRAMSHRSPQRTESVMN